MYIIEPNKPATFSMIWMHGLGADYHDMVGLVDEMRVQDLPIRHVFLQAPTRPITLNNGYQMPGWYDIFGMSLMEREDKQGILDSELIIKDAIKKECGKGIHISHILLSGFSQGGAMALFTGLRLEERLAGIVALSAYLPLSSLIQSPLDKDKADTPIFMGYGKHDPLVLPEWSELTIKGLEQIGISSIESHTYPMEHSVCFDEMVHLRRWLAEKIVQQH